MEREPVIRLGDRKGVKWIMESLRKEVDWVIMLLVTVYFTIDSVGGMLFNSLQLFKDQFQIKSINDCEAVPKL